MTVSKDTVIRLRRERGWSQEQLAAVSGLSERTIQRVEKDGSCSLDSRMALASALDVTPVELEADKPSGRSIDGDNKADWTSLVGVIIYWVLVPNVIYFVTMTNSTWEMASFLIVTGLTVVFAISSNGSRETYQLFFFTPWHSLPRQEIGPSKCNSLIVLANDVIQNSYRIGITACFVYFLATLTRAPGQLEDVSALLVDSLKPIPNTIPG